MSQQDKPKTLGQRIAAIMGEIPLMAKAGKNKHFNYSYVREVDVAELMRKLLAAHGVVVVPDMQQCERIGDLTTIRVVYTVMSADNSEDRVTSTIWATAKDGQDKGVYKASTNAHKYFFVRFFCIGSDDDVENDSGEAPPAAPAPKAASKPPVAPKRASKTPAVTYDFYYTTDRLEADRILEAAEYLERWGAVRLRVGLYRFHGEKKIPKADELLTDAPTEQELLDLTLGSDKPPGY